MQVTPLYAQAFSSLPFEQMLTMIYPEDILRKQSSRGDPMVTLTLPLAEYEKGKYLDRFLPPPLPYKREIVQAFIDRFSPDLLLEEEDILPTLDLILHVLLSKGHLMVGVREWEDEYGDPQEEEIPFLWTEKDGWYTIFTFRPGEGVVRDITQELDEVLSAIFRRPFTHLYEVSYDTIAPEIKVVLDFMTDVKRREIAYLKDKLEEEGSYEISNNGGTMVLSFDPFILHEDGYLILTEYGVYVLGVVDEAPDYTAFRLEDLPAILASETYNRYIPS